MYSSYKQDLLKIKYWNESICLFIFLPKNKLLNNLHYITQFYYLLYKGHGQRMDL